MRRTHVFIIDGTLSRLAEGQETNAGLLYKLLCKLPESDDITVGYNSGVQGKGLMKWVHVLTGHGINKTIIDGYTKLCERYRSGDQIILFGYSRGAYAVRSIAGMIDMVGLLRHGSVSKKRVIEAFNHYQFDVLSRRGRALKKKHTHLTPPRIEMIGVWDTVKSLGMPFPILSRLAPMATEFHNHALSPIILNAFQALAADENRRAFAPIPWKCQSHWHGRLEQAWFPGAHSDVGGHIFDMPKARELSNLSLVWMLERSIECGLPLPENWRQEFPTSATAPMHGPYAGSSKYFLFRCPRHFGSPEVDQLHPSISKREKSLPGYHTRLINYPLSR